MVTRMCFVVLTHEGDEIKRADHALNMKKKTAQSYGWRQANNYSETDIINSAWNKHYFNKAVASNKFVLLYLCKGVTQRIQRLKVELLLFLTL